MHLAQVKNVIFLKKQLYKSLNESEKRSFKYIYSTMHDQTMKDRLQKVKNDYHILLTCRSESELNLIKRIFKEAGYYSTYRSDVLSLKKQQLI